MCYSKTPFADLLLIPKLHAIINPDHEIAFPATIDKAAIDAMKLSLRWKPEERATIVGEYGLLNKHKFLN
jgi:serine/threonine-protein kinase TTK/MPS1